MINRVSRSHKLADNVKDLTKHTKAIKKYKAQSKLKPKKDTHTKENIDEFHYHEMMDRLSIVMGNMDDYLIAHPLCEHDDELKKDLETAFGLLFKQYQRVAEQTLYHTGEE